MEGGERSKQAGRVERGPHVGGEKERETPGVLQEKKNKVRKRETKVIGSRGQVTKTRETKRKRRVKQVGGGGGLLGAHGAGAREVR